MTTFTSAGPPEIQPGGPSRGGADDRWDRPRAVKERTADYWLALTGSLIGSGGLTWLLYEQLLPFSGTTGFIFSWFVVYVAMFAAVSALVHPRHIVIDRLWTAVITGAAGIVGAALVSSVGYIIKRGWAAVHHLNFSTQSASGGAWMAR